ncbi:MAG TPA: hypothetical protein VEM95_01940, partial [Thermoplasmata archaeon]|nr:hypothetical protein [Thermoplasmata archaeon]
MKTRNPLPATANDVWTSDVLDRVYEGPTKMSADGTVLPYIAKGVDANEDGVFERSEYGVWQERPAPSTPSDVTVYYDFNGVRWHDGMQMEAWDLIFSYHLNAMNGRFNQNLRVLYCSPYVSYDGCNRRLGVSVLPTKAWEGEGVLPGDPNLRVGIRFTLNEPFVFFAEGTLAPVLLPMHVWSRTGGGRHGDFGCAIWIPAAIASAEGMPECGTTDAAKWGAGIGASEPVP